MVLRILDGLLGGEERKRRLLPRLNGVTARDSSADTGWTDQLIATNISPRPETGSIRNERLDLRWVLMLRPYRHMGRREASGVLTARP